MNVNLVDRQPAHVACMRYTGPYGEPVSAFWRDVVAPWMGANNLFGARRYGVSHDDPSNTSAEQCRYDACVEVPDGWTGSGDYQLTTIPGGRYATVPFEGTAPDITIAWMQLLRDWLPASGQRLDNRPYLEVYPEDAGYDEATGQFTCDLCVPVMAT